MKTVVLGVTASVALYKACDLVRKLRAASFDVHVVMTPEARTLIHPSLFGSLSGNRVYHELFSEPQVWEIEHISLAERADLLLIAPATANIIAKCAAGICDDLLSCVVMATRAPVVICPAMNDNMYSHAVTQENVDKLRKLGYTFIGPEKGELACGKQGIGRFCDPADIVQEVKRILCR